MLVLRMAVAAGAAASLVAVLLWLITGRRAFLRAGGRILLITAILILAYVGLLFGGRLLALRAGV
jgi:hypothetical protein